MELGLAMFQTTFNVDVGAVAAGSLFSIMPILLVYLLFRKQIMESIALSGLKG
jgi:multiple sugar transport system permease protein